MIHHQNVSPQEVSCSGWSLGYHFPPGSCHLAATKMGAQRVKGHPPSLGGKPRSAQCPHSLLPASPETPDEMPLVERSDRRLQGEAVQQRSGPRPGCPPHQIQRTPRPALSFPFSLGRGMKFPFWLEHASPGTVLRELAPCKQPAFRGNQLRLLGRGVSLGPADESDCSRQ